MCAFMSLFIPSFHYFYTVIITYNKDTKRERERTRERIENIKNKVLNTLFCRLLFRKWKPTYTTHTFFYLETAYFTKLPSISKPIFCNTSENIIVKTAPIYST